MVVALIVVLQILNGHPTFVCTRCAGIHRGLGVQVSKIKHLKLDKWDESHLHEIEEMGNAKVKMKYEQNVPIFYRKPRECDPHILVEQWIKAKYLRQEFIYRKSQTYLGGTMEGYLWKRGKNDPRFQPRKFVLSENEGSLKYFLKEKKAPKAVLKLTDLNVVLSPEKLCCPNSLQLTFLRDGTTRHIYVQHDDPQVIVDWYQAIRCAKLHQLQVAFPAASDSQLLPMLSNDFAMEGWLWKTGPKFQNVHKKRWFTMDNRKLMYHDHPLDANPKGEIFLGNHLCGYSVRVGVPPNVKDHGFSFTLCTPNQTFYLSALKEEERDKWITLIGETLSKQLTPQDNVMAVNLIRKRPSVSSINMFTW
ncbi:hypothetical protein RUM44_011845 [Polyplax serrata]|uniref:Arf-GAP with dual PH domain-containing protein 1-like n=1 Tax=Polyplax serrata TaxID=468196 RepID=A0ABR1BBJ7_POLSC